MLEGRIRMLDELIALPEVLQMHELMSSAQAEQLRVVKAAEEDSKELSKDGY